MALEALLKGEFTEYNHWEASNEMKITLAGNDAHKYAVHLITMISFFLFNNTVSLVIAVDKTNVIQTNSNDY